MPEGGAGCCGCVWSRPNWKARASRFDVDVAGGCGNAFKYAALASSTSLDTVSPFSFSFPDTESSMNCTDKL
eukprot:scaffold10855_cov57-Skeletonema_menzelii.AAC.1